MADDGVEAEAARIAEAARKRRLRYAAIAAMGLSLVLCVLLLLPKKAKKLAAPPPLPHGVITHVYEEARRLIIASADDGGPSRSSFRQCPNLHQRQTVAPWRFARARPGGGG